MHPKKCKNVALVMMVKNESARICQTTFDSVKDYISQFVIFDTGSTDDTVDVITKYCEKHSINLHLKQGNFVNFCVSRNELLDFADQVLDKNTFMLLMDANDEMKNMELLYKFANNYKGTCSGFYITQQWWVGNALESYYNIRIVLSHHLWRYKGVVHEYITTSELQNTPEHLVTQKLDNIIIYQDRTADDDKSLRRFSRDKELLYKEFLKDPHEPRNLFYLAQTCSCLNDNQESYKYYILRTKELGFYEEVYHSYYRLGELSEKLNHDWEESLCWYLKAFQHSQRVEPLINIAKHYKNYNFKGENTPEWHTCYMYINMACQLTWPVDQILFINKRAYTYERWHLMGIAAYYVGRYNEGLKACVTAIKAENNQIDINNLKFYIQKELETLEGKPMKHASNMTINIMNTEIRSKSQNEFENKHNINQIINKIINDIKQERKQTNKPINNNIFKKLIDNSKKY